MTEYPKGLHRRLPAMEARKEAALIFGRNGQPATRPTLLLEMENAPRQPREVVVGDITYLPLFSGKWGYLASWQDQFSKRIVGWAVEGRMTDVLVIKAFEKAVKGGRIKHGPIVHTNGGGQYVSNYFVRQQQPAKQPLLNCV